jgi:peptide/nickel transport system permease protein
VTAYIVRRLLYSVFVVFGVVTLVFFSLQLAPGDPISLLLPAEGGGAASQELADRLRARYGLDLPLHQQYLRYLGRVVQGDLGTSIRTGRSITGELQRLYPATLELTLAALVIAIVIGTTSGVFASLHRNGPIDHLSMVFALLGVSLPNFLLGVLLMLVFSLQLGWLPPSGRVGGVGSWEAIRFLIMPAVTLGVAAAAIIARLVRSAMLDVLSEDYVRTAKAKGLRQRSVVLRHALRNALLPVVTVIGLQFGALLAGAVIAETIFSWPGIGRFLIVSITGKDFPAVQGAVMGIAVTFVLVNLLVDLLYAAIDPRVRYA